MYQHRNPTVHVCTSVEIKGSRLRDNRYIRNYSNFLSAYMYFFVLFFCVIFFFFLILFSFLGLCRLLGYIIILLLRELGINV